MIDSTLKFYNLLADEYHLIFNDWVTSMEHHAKTIDKLIQNKKGIPQSSLNLLDCSCGIGTQAIGLAKLGYNVTASDLSSKAIQRAKREAKKFGVNKIKFNIADFRELERQIKGFYDVIISFDNSLPHLMNDYDLKITCANIRNKLNKEGLFLASIRDYDKILNEKPSIITPYFINDEHGKRVTFQVWEWEERVYTLNHFIIKEKKGLWKTKHRSTKYRAIMRNELSAILAEIGFCDIKWHLPEQTGFYQPIIEAIKR